MKLHRLLFCLLLVSANAVAQVVEQNACESAKKNLEQSSEVEVHESLVVAKRLEGKIVIRDQHEPLPGAVVELLSDDGHTCSQAVVADRKGWFRFPKVKGGIYSLRVSKPGFNTTELKYQVKKGRQRTPTITMTPGH